KTEQELTEAGVPYEVGLSKYKELARGAILGEAYGMLKILVSPEDRRILGVHVLGTGATEVVHIGQAVMGNDGTLDYLLDTVFNYPTLAEACKVAALDAQIKLHRIKRMTATVRRAVWPGRRRRSPRAPSPARTSRWRTRLPRFPGRRRSPRGGTAGPIRPRSARRRWPERCCGCARRPAGGIARAATTGARHPVPWCRSAGRKRPGRPRRARGHLP